MPVLGFAQFGCTEVSRLGGKLGSAGCPGM
jgi:hypothetical protein